MQPEHQLPTQTPIRGLTSIKQPIGPRIEHGPIAFYPDLILRLPPRPPDVTALKDTRKDLLDLDTDRNINFEKNSPYQEGIIYEMHERLDKAHLKEPLELKDLIDSIKLVQKFLPKQTDIDKILDVIKRKVQKVHIYPLPSKKFKQAI